jgi:leucyl/phenylalanyl-tRNA--protein transferase
MLAAYRAGVFPMPLSRHGPLGWWSPDPRGIIVLDRLHVSRSLRRSCRRYDVRVDAAFAEVVRHCADPRRPHGWITPRMRAAYQRLHELGWAHSVETYDSDGRLVGGVFGVAVGGLFAGESMFHRARDASKVALVALVDLLRDEWAADRLLDVQWTTRHLCSLGAEDVSREEYLARLRRALPLPQPAFRSA